MSNQFNFFQYDGTGSDGKPYRINPIVTYFTGVYFPAELIEGSDVGFIWRIKEDDVFYPTRYDTRFKGEVGKSSNDVHSYSFLVSGNLFPVSSDSGAYWFAQSGNQIRDNIDTITGTIPFSGAVKSGQGDNPTYYLAFSGAFPIFYNDSSNLDITLHNNLLTGTNDYQDFSNRISGSVVRKNKDNANIDFNFTGVLFKVGGRALTISTGDIFSIDLELSKVFFSPP